MADSTSANEMKSGSITEVMNLLKEVPNYVSNVLNTVQSISEAVKNEELQTSKGLSFLDVKNQTLLSYNINLTHIILQKLSGKKIEGDPTVERLVELRTVLEKMRPIDERLKHQIKKLLSVVSTGNVDTKDPLRFKANPDNLSPMDVEAEESEVEESKVYIPPRITATHYHGGETIETRKKKILQRAQKKALSSSMLQELRSEYDTGPEEIRDVKAEESKVEKSKVYVPPRITATHYYGDETIETRKKKILQRAQKKALSSSMLQELRSEYDTGPEEIRETIDPGKIRLNKEMKERARYEEDNFIRLPMTKKQKHEAKQLTTVTNLKMKYDDISALDLRPDDMTLRNKSSGKRKSMKNKGKKRSFKKRH